MAKPTEDRTPRRELSGKELGVPTRADVERRAVELAPIDNRPEATDEDRIRVLAEFQDRTLPDAVNEDADTMQSMSRDPSDPLVDRGHRIPDHVGEDEKTMVEKLALEGVEEAQHDQMIQSRNLVDEPFRSRPKRRE